MSPDHPNTQHAQTVLATKDPDTLVDESYEIQVYGATLLQPEGDVLSTTDYRLYKRRWIGLGALHTPNHFVRADRFRLAVMALLNMVSAINLIWFSAIASASRCTFRVYGAFISHPPSSQYPVRHLPHPGQLAGEQYKYHLSSLIYRFTSDR